MRQRATWLPTRPAPMMTALRVLMPSNFMRLSYPPDAAASLVSRV